MVEVLHDRQDGCHSRRYPSRHIWHDFDFCPAICARYLQAARPARKRHNEGPDGRSRWRSGFQCAFDCCFLLLEILTRYSCLASHVDEILLSSDKTIAVIDGSGVLADPAGINREELVRLAKLRIPVENFNKSKLSKDGYLVRVEDQDVKLPCM